MNKEIFRIRNLTSGFLLVISFWLLVHIFAILGIILSLLNLVLSIFSPTKSFCIFCIASKNKKYCYTCLKKQEQRTIFQPRYYLFSLINCLILVIFSLISVGLVYGETIILSRLGFGIQSKTASITIPTTGQYKIGEIFPLKFEVSNIPMAINAVQADIAYDSEAIEIIDISTSESFATIFLQKEINNRQGWARLTGGLPNPGFYENSGTFMTIYFRGKSSGIATVELLPSSMILANDGKGTNILKDYSSASYLILPEYINEDDQTLQHKLLSNTEILGISTTSGQLIFYDEPDVLGSHIDTLIKEHKQDNLIAKFLNTIFQFNQSILGVWEKIFTIIIS